MRFEFEELGLMSVAEFEALCHEVCGRLKLEGEPEVEKGNRSIRFESYEGEVCGYFHSGYANGELIVEGPDVELAVHIEAYLRGKGVAPVVKVHAV